MRNWVKDVRLMVLYGSYLFLTFFMGVVFVNLALFGKVVLREPSTWIAMVEGCVCFGCTYIGLYQLQVEAMERKQEVE